MSRSINAAFSRTKRLPDCSHTVGLLIVLSVVSFSGACQKSSVARSSRDLASSITKSRAVQQLPANAAIPVLNRRVYIDSSLSMKGFANAENHTTFDELLDEIGNVLPGCKLYKYGQTGSRPPQNLSDLFTQVGFGREIHSPGFYNLSYNPDDLLINAFANEDQPTLSVLITDGVYSEPEGSTAPPVVDAIQKWMQGGRVLGILEFKSSFNGPFYSEHRRTMMPVVSVESRPFYAFVFSPTEQGFTDLEEKLRSRFQDVGSILFSNQVASINITVPSGAKGLYSSKSPPEVPFYWRMYDPDLFSRNPASINYNIKYSISPNYPAAQFKIDLTPDYYRWEQNKFRRIESGPPAGFGYAADTNQASDASSSNFVITFPRDSISDYGFYDLKVSASVRSIRPEILDLSTRDDSLRENAKKTYRFFELITAVTEVHFKSQLAAKLSPAIFVTIANH